MTNTEPLHRLDAVQQHSYKHENNILTVVSRAECIKLYIMHEEVSLLPYMENNALAILLLVFKS